MKKISFLILSLTIVITGSSQDVLGKWYGLNKSSFTEVDISSDTLKGQVLESDSDLIGHERGSIKHSGIYKLKDRTILVIPDDKTSNVTRYRALTIFNIVNKVSFEIAANGISGPTETIEEVIQLSTDDTTKLFGKIVFYKDYLTELKSLKNVESMNVEDFKQFLRIYIDKKNKYEEREKIPTGTIQDQLTTRALIGMGFNPIKGLDLVDRFFEKFIVDKEVEDLWRKI